MSYSRPRAMLGVTRNQCSDSPRTAMSYTIERFRDSTALAEAAAHAWLKFLKQAHTQQKSLTVALSGGRIASAFFGQFVAAIRSENVDPAPLQLFWADERGVSADDPQSNYFTAAKHLIEPLNLAPQQVHRVRGERPPEIAAEEVTREVQQLLPAGPNGKPEFDLVILGMGEDGHVASLFPNAPMPDLKSEPIYRAVVGDKPPPQRITLGYSTIASARETLVLISGSGKAETLRSILEMNADLPLGRILKLRKKTKIFSEF